MPDDQPKEERLRYHSVSHSEKQPVNREISSSDYLTIDIPEPYAAAIFALHPPLDLARFVPQDRRIELAFDFHWQAQRDEFQWKNHPIALQPNRHERNARRDYLVKKAKSNVESLASFFEENLRTFGAFIIRDTDPLKPDARVLYNIGCNMPYADGRRDEKTQRFTDGQELFHWLEKQKMFRPGHVQPDGVAPWQRVILCQGLSLTSLTGKQGRPVPFLVFDVGNDPIRMAIDLHLSDERRGGSEVTNPYSNPHNAFHITFYERLGSGSDALIKRSLEKNLKIGHLYNKPQKDYGKNAADKLAFRQSSFTMITTARHTQIDAQCHFPSNGEYYWTVLILSPSGFFPADSDQDWKIDAGQISEQTFGLSCIVYALRKVEEQWRQFNDHIGSLLVEDFMDPRAYTKLLFDDETFSRSRLYFWILGCLNEFQVSIEDNIKQWKLFRQARICHLLDLPPNSSPDASLPQLDRLGDLARLRELDKEAGEIRQSLEDIQAQFRAKSATVQALRDGLFNASALMETRSSTRLGQNVQLLTYVSIFYLPLAFCAALWAIPNITDGDTRTPFIVTAFLVGFITYAVVFNLGNIAQAFGRVYFARRSRLLGTMKDDHDSFWQQRWEQFAEFPPNEEQKVPSEWWIFRYQLRTLFKRRSKAAMTGDP